VIERTVKEAEEVAMVLARKARIEVAAPAKAPREVKPRAAAKAKTKPRKKAAPAEG